MAEKKEIFGSYFVKKFIIEVKHKPNLLHNESVPQILNDMMGDFNKVTLINDPVQKTFQILNSNNYFMFTSDWTKVSTTFENVKDFESDFQKATKNIISYLTKLKITAFTRLGFRVSYLLPFNGNFEELVTLFKDKFYNNLSIYEPFGNIEDVGIAALTINDKKFKGHLSIGPMTKIEVKNKISEFKNYDIDFESSLLVDLDLYIDTTSMQSMKAFVDVVYDASRLKIVKFREHLNS